MNNISAASNFFSVLLFRVQHSHPYSRIDQVYVLSVTIFVKELMFLLVKLTSFCQKYLWLLQFFSFFTVAPCILCCVSIYPKYLNIFTCLISTPLHDILHVGAFDFFDTTMHSVFFVVSSSPLSSLLTLTVVRGLCNFCSESAIRTVSSVYLKLLIYLSPTFIPLSSSMFLRIISLYKLKR